MAVWQADFEVEVPGRKLGVGYQELLRTLLPDRSTWSADLKIWGTEAGDRIDVFHASANEDEILARFDMRQWRPGLYAAFVDVVRRLGGTIRVASAEGDGAVVALDAFEQALRASDAFRFVLDPEAYFRSLDGTRDDK